MYDFTEVFKALDKVGVNQDLHMLTAIEKCGECVAVLSQCLSDAAEEDLVCAIIAELIIALNMVRISVGYEKVDGMIERICSHVATLKNEHKLVPMH